MAARVFEELEADNPKRHFTIGIIDDVTHLSLKWDPEISTEADDVTRAVFYGLGSDGTVGASKNSVKIIGENTPMYAQGYFVYDSKKAGSVTVSHVRFSPRPIDSTYLIDRANFVACHQFHFLERIDVLKVAEPGATFLLNSPYGPDEVWDQLPHEVQQQIIDKAAEVLCRGRPQGGPRDGNGRPDQHDHADLLLRLAGVLPRDQAIEQIKKAIRKTYGKRGESILRTELCRRRCGAGRPASKCKYPTQVTQRSASAAAGLGEDVRLRPTRHGDVAGRPRRSAAGQRPAGRWHVSHRHRQGRKAEHRSRDSDLGSGDLHRVRVVRAGLPACGDPLEGLSPPVAQRRTWRFPVQGRGRARSCPTTS